MNLRAAFEKFVTFVNCEGNSPETERGRQIECYRRAMADLAVGDVIEAGIKDKSCGCHYEDWENPDTSPIVTCDWCKAIERLRAALEVNNGG